MIGCYRVFPTDVRLEIDLGLALKSFHGSELSCEDSAVLHDWLAGPAQLQIISPHHFIDDALYAEISRQAAFFEGPSHDHQLLGVLGAAYLHSRGKAWRVGGRYAGGRADVSAVDGTLFIECGTLNPPSRIIEALRAGQSLLVLPYDDGASISLEVERSLIVRQHFQLGLLFTSTTRLTHPRLEQRTARDAEARRRVTLWGTGGAAPPELEVPAAFIERINEAPPASSKLSPRERLRAARRARLKG